MVKKKINHTHIYWGNDTKNSQKQISITGYNMLKTTMKKFTNGN